MPKLQVSPNASASFAGTVLARKQYAVETKQYWSDAWARQPYLEAVSGSACVAPDIGQATFEYHYGSIKREDTASFSTYYDLALDGWYIRVVDLETGDAVWTGIVEETAQAPYGGKTGAGRQTFTAYSLFHLLDRAPISWCQVESNGTTTTAQHCPTLNYRETQGAGVLTKTKLGNRSDAQNADNVYEFSADGALWSTLDAVQMILAKYAPANGPTFQLAGQYADLAQFHPVVELEGHTPWDALQRLIDRRRGFGFKEVVVGSTVQVHVFSLVDEAVIVQGVTIPANVDPVSFDLDTRIDLQDPEIWSSTAARFDKIEVRGDRLLSCFTLAYVDGTLTEGWTAALETSYATAASGQAGYASSTAADQADVNDTVRQLDTFEAVYSKHIVPAAWNGTSGNGAGGATNVALPTCSATGGLGTNAAGAFFSVDKRFEHFLPFVEGYDYSTDPPTENGATSEPAWQKPFALVKAPTTWATNIGSALYHFTDRPGPGYETANAHLKIYPREAAIGVCASPRHAYGLNHFSTSTAASYNDDPVFDYTQVLATVAMRTDEVARVGATRAGFETSAELRTKLIQLRDAQIWYVAPNTVVGVGANLALKRIAGDGLVRDDRPYMWAVCTAALAWYGRERRSVRIPLRSIVPIPLGAMMKSVYTGKNEVAVNSAITALRWQWAENRMSIETQWAELDWSEL